MRVAAYVALLFLTAACGGGGGERAVESFAPRPTPTELALTQTATPRPLYTPRPRAARRPVAASAPTAAPSDKAPVGASIADCPLFPSDNAWRRNVAKDPVDPRSDAYINSISQGGAFLHADFGSNRQYGIPYVVVPKDQKKVPINFTDYEDESDPGPYPIPLDAPREAGSDRHVLAVQRETCKLYELFNASRTDDGWSASSGAVFDLRSNKLRPAGWTSADAAGLPILPGLVRREETNLGDIRHALRFTAPDTQRGYVDPARHFASSDTSRNLPPMGLRVRLKSSYNISKFTGHSRVILKALKTYGMILADNGSGWFISGANDTGWDDDDLNQLKRVPGSAFEAVKHGTVHR